jgi:hypothetical protein
LVEMSSAGGGSMYGRPFDIVSRTRCSWRNLRSVGTSAASSATWV